MEQNEVNSIGSPMIKGDNHRQQESFLKGSLIIMTMLFVALASTQVYSQQSKTKKMTETAATTKTQFAIIDNQKLAYRKIGRGSPIILTNRFRGTLDTWDPLFLDLLAKNNTVTTFAGCRGTPPCGGS